MALDEEKIGMEAGKSLVFALIFDPSTILTDVMSPVIE
jgi:hypothetical protein